MRKVERTDSFGRGVGFVYISVELFLWVKYLNELVNLTSKADLNDLLTHPNDPMTVKLTIKFQSVPHTKFQKAWNIALKTFIILS